MASAAASLLPDRPTASERLSVWSIAAGTALCSCALNFWWPFLPLYMQHLGAKSDADALFWVAVATTAQGLGRIIAGPVWGMLSDRYGRKLMYVRALYAATGTALIAAFATEPWHIAVALAAQGAFSGFVPAAVALTSVSVPDRRLNSSLGLVTGGQYLGTTLGPAAGSILAVVLGYRGAILISALLPALAATFAVFVVPRDVLTATVAKVKTPRAGSRWTLAPLRSFSNQFYLAVFLGFALFALNQLVRFTTPFSLQDMSSKEHAKAAAGVAFSVGGFASVIGAVVVARMVVRPGRLRWALAVLCGVSAIAHILLAMSGVESLYILSFGLLSLAMGAMIPATNTLIASTVAAHRRGTAFGIASSAQSVAFMVGPTGAALIAAWSLPGGLLVVAGLFAAMGAVLAFALRETAPTIIELEPSTASAPAT